MVRPLAWVAPLMYSSYSRRLIPARVQWADQISRGVPKWTAAMRAMPAKAMVGAVA
ncbi:hypothetical protein SAMN05421870_102200 [Streptomyces qinglanensis]|uniref:Uncharacterized protein n=1 Tax=Streptomyces qinglanensis TaxID=943816 RepID=A0A1H9PRD2_9ACTN|nr:hypothetical protein SAMN05421870_102200 [Streptomyces qinglanensis]